MIYPDTTALDYVYDLIRKIQQMKNAWTAKIEPMALLANVDDFVTAKAPDFNKIQ
jgi:hypothetical protein